MALIAAASRFRPKTAMMIAVQTVPWGNPVAALPDKIISFEQFEFLPGRRLLIEQGVPLPLGARAIAILQVLLERPGDLVKKETLLAQVWPDTLVGDGSLRYHIAGLRRELGDGRSGRRFIVNEAGMGYRFVAPVSIRHETSAHANASRNTFHNLPPRELPILGRDRFIEELVGLHPLQRLMTITGIGGIGKTTVATAVARRLTDRYADGTVYVDLAPLTDLKLVPVTLASLLGVQIAAQDPTLDIVEFLRDKQMLLVIDNCEHLVDTAARMAEAVLRAALNVSIIATSREPLRIPGEYLHRMVPLDVPGSEKTRQEISAFPSVQLFVARATANVARFAPDDEEMRAVADICRRLDGLPLPLELAAAAVEAFGVRELAIRLNDRFSVLIHGQRTALPRHQTLRAMIDWSFEALSPDERTVLARVSIFSGEMSYADATAVCALGGMSQNAVYTHLLSLVAKSLVTVHVRNSEAKYRLLESVRAYAREKLRASGEYNTLSRILARHCDKAIVARDVASRTSGRIAYASQLDDLRQSIAWAFSDGNDIALGISLAVVSTPLMLLLGLEMECTNTLEIALEHIDDTTPMRSVTGVYAALGSVIMFSTGDGPRLVRTWGHLLDLAKRIDDRPLKLNALFGIHVGYAFSERMDLSHIHARQMLEEAIEAGDAGAADIASTMLSNTQQSCGDSGAALETLALHVAPRELSVVTRERFIFDPTVVRMTGKARALWIVGKLDQALFFARAAVEEALEIRHEPSLVYALIQVSCAVAIAIGDFETAEQFVSYTQDIIGDNPMRRDLCTLHEGAFLSRQGRVDDGLKLIESSVERLGKSLNNIMPTKPFFVAALAESQFRVGRFDDAEETADMGLQTSRDGGGTWVDPEYLRIKANAMIGRARPVADVQAVLEESLALSRRQGALFWELRAATDLSRLFARQARLREADGLLSVVLEKFSEGFDRPDVREAIELQAQIRA